MFLHTIHDEQHRDQLGRYAEPNPTTPMCPSGVGARKAILPNTRGIGSISCLPVMNSPDPSPHKLRIRPAYVNFGPPRLADFRNPCLFYDGFEAYDGNFTSGL